MQNGDKWIGVYYPLEMIPSQRSRALLCLFFDRVICHFPVCDLDCGNVSGASEVLWGDSPLVKAGIVELREERLRADIEVHPSADSWWGTDEEFDRYVRLQVTTMAMDVCRTTGYVPVTDDPHWPLPASLLQNLNLLRSSRLQAFALASQCLEIVLPPIADIPDEDILKARQELVDQLVPFRRAMLALSPAVRSGIEQGATLLDIEQEARYVVDTQVAPALGELQERLRKEKGALWRRMLLKAAPVIPRFALNWTTQGALTAAVDAIDNLKDLGVDLIDQNRLSTSLLKSGGLGYLLAISQHPVLQKQVPSPSSAPI